MIDTDIDQAAECMARWRGRIVRGDSANIQSPEALRSRHAFAEFRNWAGDI